MRRLFLLAQSAFLKVLEMSCPEPIDKRNTGTCSTFLPDTVLVYVIL